MVVFEWVRLSVDAIIRFWAPYFCIPLSYIRIYSSSMEIFDLLVFAVCYSQERRITFMGSFTVKYSWTYLNIQSRYQHQLDIWSYICYQCNLLNNNLGFQDRVQEFVPLLQDHAQYNVECLSMFHQTRKKARINRLSISRALISVAALDAAATTDFEGDWFCTYTHYVL